MLLPTRCCPTSLHHLHKYNRFYCLFCRNICSSMPYLLLLKVPDPKNLCQYQRKVFLELDDLQLLILSFSKRKTVLQLWVLISRKQSKEQGKHDLSKEQYDRFWSDGDCLDGTWVLLDGRRGQRWGQRWKLRKWGVLTWWLWQLVLSRFWFDCRYPARECSPNWL